MTAKNQIFRLKFSFCRPFHPPPPPPALRLPVQAICSVSSVVIMQFVYCLEVDRSYRTVFCVRHEPILLAAKWLVMQS
jgi:hypothetical protein